MIARVRRGDDSELLTEEDEDDIAADDAALRQFHQTPDAYDEVDEAGTFSESPATTAARRTQHAPSLEPKLPPALARLLGTEAEHELMAVARFLDARNKKGLTLVFHTPIGDVKCPVNWSSTEPSQLYRCKHMLMIMVRSSESMFVPHPGSDLEISFWEHRDTPRLRVTCLAPPMQLYPGVGIDLLCFLPQTEPVEKQGVLHDGAPSVVSGRPSTHTETETGEPVSDGEKSAGVHFVGANWPTSLNTSAEDFDKPRS